MGARGHAGQGRNDRCPGGMQRGRDAHLGVKISRDLRQRPLTRHTRRDGARFEPHEHVGADRDDLGPLDLQADSARDGECGVGNLSHRHEVVTGAATGTKCGW